MAYTSVLPVHRLERSIDYVKDRTKTTKSASIRKAGYRVIIWCRALQKGKYPPNWHI